MQKTVIVIGAGKSTIYLLEYLYQLSEKNKCVLHIADIDITHLSKRYPNANLHVLTVEENSDTLASLVALADIVVSMVPAFMHPIVAKECIKYKKHLITPSYISDALLEMESEVKANGLLFLNELGVDPGIDHMSAMHIIHRLQREGATIRSFESYCGGLIAPESDNNPWHYKFTWNPRNVILAGQGTAKYLLDGMYKYIPYTQLFQRTDRFDIDDYGQFEGYANRDSLKYINAYGLKGIKTMYRGTFRRPPYCQAWNVFVQLGVCDDTYQIEHDGQMSYAQFISSFIGGNNAIPLRERFIQETGIDESLCTLFDYLDLFSETKFIPLHRFTPAQALQAILEPCLKLEEGDKDLLVMLHLFEYELDGKSFSLQSTLVVSGQDPLHTAMAKTVGLPVAIACKLMLEDRIPDCGVLMPIKQSIYEPIMEELKLFGIEFSEKVTMVS